MKTTKIAGFGEMVKNGSAVNRVTPLVKDTHKESISQALTNNVAKKENGDIDIYTIFQATDANNQLKADLNHMGYVRQEMLAHVFGVDFFSGNFENIVYDIIINTPLRNEYKVTMKKTLKRLVAMLSGKTQELIIDDKKGGTLSVSIDDVVLESPVQKFAGQLGKAVAQSDYKTGETTNIKSIMAMVTLAIQAEHEKQSLKTMDALSKAHKGSHKAMSKAIYEDEKRESKTAEMAILENLNKEVKTRKAKKTA